jgi:hypothetical protein
MTRERSATRLLNNLGKRPHFQTGTADERAVNIRLRHQLCDVVGLDAAAVENVTPIGGVGAEPLT